MGSGLEKIILVDVNDNEVGVDEKLRIHYEGTLHRAFSVFVFNSRGQFLLQQRAAGKYHSAGLWSNTCCGHPRPAESVAAAARRRLNEEMGFDCDLVEVFSFVYRVPVSNDMIEHEFDHVLIGRFDGVPHPDPEEASSWQWIHPGDLAKNMRENPEQYTYWLRLSFENVLNCLPQDGRDHLNGGMRGEVTRK